MLFLQVFAQATPPPSPTHYEITVSAETAAGSAAVHGVPVLAPALPSDALAGGAVEAEQQRDAAARDGRAVTPFEGWNVFGFQCFGGLSASALLDGRLRERVHAVALSQVVVEELAFADAEPGAPVPVGEICRLEKVSMVPGQPGADVRLCATANVSGKVAAAASPLLQVWVVAPTARGPRLFMAMWSQRGGGERGRERKPRRRVRLLPRKAWQTSTVYQ